MLSRSHSAPPYRAPRTGASGLIESLERAADSARAALVEDLRRQVQAGDYVPNLHVVAERLLVDLDRDEEAWRTERP